MKLTNKQFDEIRNLRVGAGCLIYRAIETNTVTIEDVYTTGRDGILRNAHTGKPVEMPREEE